jgi:hypothetical protein
MSNTKAMFNLDSLKREYDGKSIKLDEFRDSLKKKGFLVRVTCVNGKHLVHTADFKQNRVNIEVSGAKEIKKVIALDKEMQEIYNKETHEVIKYEYGPESIVIKIVSMG